MIGKKKITKIIRKIKTVKIEKKKKRKKKPANFDQRKRDQEGKQNCHKKKSKGCKGPREYDFAEMNFDAMPDPELKFTNIPDEIQSFDQFKELMERNK